MMELKWQKKVVSFSTDTTGVVLCEGTDDDADQQLKEITRKHHSRINDLKF